MVTVEQLLTHLPPFRNERVLVKDNQHVHDIIEQILKAHEKYGHYYDRIAEYFDDADNEKICNSIYKFLQKNIEYREESDEEQTTAVPSAILSLKHGDCKHYSSFTAGVLDALKRQGKKINWCYRFCSYKILDKTPHHVFVVVKNKDGSESWIDPVPGAEKITPVWQLDKQPKNKIMPLHDVVGNINNGDAIGGASIGYTTSEQLMHAAAKINPTFILGRAAFLQMLKWNVRAWAKNIDDLSQKYGHAAADPIGKRWYLFGGDSAPFWSAIAEGKDKKMIGSSNGDAIGFTGVEITAMITASAPIIIAMVSLVKSITGNNQFESGQVLYPTSGTTLPPTTGTSATELLKNPLVLAGGAAVLYYLYTSSKKKVSGTTNNSLLWLLLLGGGGYLLYKNQQVANELPPPTQEPVVYDSNNTLDVNPVDIVYPVTQNFDAADNLPIEAMM